MPLWLGNCSYITRSSTFFQEGDKFHSLENVLSFLFCSVPVTELLRTSSICRKCGTNLFSYLFPFCARSWLDFLFVWSDLLKYQSKHENKGCLWLILWETENKSSPDLNRLTISEFFLILQVTFQLWPDY